MQNPSQKITRSNAIRLFFTDTRFLIDGLPYPDLPMFVDVRTMRHLYLPTEWMIDLATCQARCESPLSWKSYAYDLRGFFEFAIVKGFDWLHPEEMQIGHYGVDLTRQGRSRNHINQVMSTICRFYEWAAERGSITTLALRYETVRLTQHGYFAHIQDKKKLSARAIVIPRRRRDERLPQFFHAEKRCKILNVLEERDQIIAEWALHTGLREHEICALTVDQIPDEQSYCGERFYRLVLRKTKHATPGNAIVPTWLIDKTYQYIAIYGRADVKRRALTRGHIVSNNIFLSNIGNDLKPDSVYNIFKHALNGLGIDGTFHDLRHTYAIAMLDLLIRASDANPTRDNGNPMVSLRLLMRVLSDKTAALYQEARKQYLTDTLSKAWELPDVSEV